MRRGSPTPVPDARAVVLLVLDGLAGRRRKLHAGTAAEALRDGPGGPITTVVPSTTPAALTSITTGLPPAEHGVIGFRIRVDGDVLNVLRWQQDERQAPARPVRGPAPRRRSAGARSRSSRSPSSALSGFTGVHLRDADFVGWRTTASSSSTCAPLVAGASRFVYAYYPGIDEVAHAFGLHDGFYTAELAAADRLVGEVLDVLPDDAALARDRRPRPGAPRPRWLDPARRRSTHWSTSYAGDGRFRYLHAREGAAAELLAAAEDTLGERRVGVHARPAARRGLARPRPAGPPRAPRRRRRARRPRRRRLHRPAMPRETGLGSAHGSLTAAEMLVPLPRRREGAPDPIG